MSKKPPLNPPQHQDKQPGIESKMHPRPQAESEEYYGSNKLKNKVAVITGGDTGKNFRYKLYFLCFI